MRSYGWALIQCDWCLYKKRRLKHRHTHRENHVRLRRWWHLEAKERGLRRNHPANTLILDSSLQNCE
ncbi:unnamed protein product [Nyctereutes procyonoides]|uniref:(raccoon dog) hypothetical protein n=1 Tax=Nyctereutes procyonoides TaxID=34880 RepID=A0A811YHM4_NYCPR|nr:unnamed protein product [Nyctereutes procyonoides]